MLVAVFGSTKEDETRPLVIAPVAVEDKRDEQAFARCDEVSVGAQEAAVGEATTAAAAAAPDAEATAAAERAAEDEEEDEEEEEEEEKGV